MTHTFGLSYHMTKSGRDKSRYDFSVEKEEHRFYTVLSEVDVEDLIDCVMDFIEYKKKGF